jgi:hypothetical protein
VILVRAPHVPVHTGTHGEPPAMADTNITDRASKRFPAHAALLPAPLHGGTRLSDRACTKPRNALAGRLLLCQVGLRRRSRAALAGRADLRGDQPPELLRLGQVGGVWHPLDLLEGYHTPARGQSQTTHTPVPMRAAPRLPCGRAAPDRRDATPAPSVQDRLLGP